MHRPPTALGVALLTPAGPVLACCSTDTPAPGASASTPGGAVTEPTSVESVAADTSNLTGIKFARMMIVHQHGDMAQIEIDGRQNPAAFELAHQVVVDQSAEITCADTAQVRVGRRMTRART